MTTMDLRQYVAKWFVARAEYPYLFADDFVSLCLEDVLSEMARENLATYSDAEIELLILQRWFAFTERKLTEARDKLQFLKTL